MKMAVTMAKARKAMKLNVNVSTTLVTRFMNVVSWVDTILR